MRSPTRRIWILPAVCAVLAAAGCMSTSDGVASGAGAGGVAGDAIPSPTMPYQTPTPTVSPAADADAGEAILYELRARVLAEAGVPGEVSGSCTPALTDNPTRRSGAGVVSRCTIRYVGLAIGFTVRIRGGAAVSGFTATQHRAPITRAGVRAAFAVYAYATDPGPGVPAPGSVRCDDRLPERGLVTFDRPSGFTCSYEDGSGRAIRSHVTISERGPRFS